MVPACKWSGGWSPGDVVIHTYGGGGGYGDPLDRPSKEVLEDVERGAVTAMAAHRDYGVLVVRLDAGWTVDEAATTEARDARRRSRLQGALQPREPLKTPPAGRRVSSRLTFHSHDDGQGRFACRRCGYDIGPQGENVKLHLLMAEEPISERHPEAVDLPGSHRFVIRYFYCPGCGSQVEVEVNLKSEPPIWTVEPL